MRYLYAHNQFSWHCFDVPVSGRLLSFETDDSVSYQSSHPLISHNTLLFFKLLNLDFVLVFCLFLKFEVMLGNTVFAL